MGQLLQLPPVLVARTLWPSDTLKLESLRHRSVRLKRLGTIPYYQFILQII